MSRTIQRNIRAGYVALLLASAFATFIADVSATHSKFGHKHVRAGESIQKAIDAAHVGDRIHVSAGTYLEQLTIKTDGISLFGKGAILRPPSTPASNLCSGLAGNDTEAGICVAGDNVVLGPFPGTEHRKVQSVGRPVEGVSVIGFEIHGFSGPNIALVGARDAKATGNKLVDGIQYGLLTVGSTNTVAKSNKVSTTGELGSIGMCMDDMATAHFIANEVSGYFVGYCVQTPGADVRDNEARDNCVGVFVDPGVKGAQIIQNRISSLNPECLKLPPPNGGILVDGSIDTLVKQNFITGQINPGLAGGIIVVDDTMLAAVASGNVVTQNSLHNNTVDLFIQSTGSGNSLTGNQCSTPPELCSR
jgi:hypothetical protein